MTCADGATMVCGWSKISKLEANERTAEDCKRPGKGEKQGAQVVSFIISRQDPGHTSPSAMAGSSIASAEETIPAVTVWTMPSDSGRAIPRLT